MAGPFPGAPDNLDLHTTDGGTVYQYLSDHGRWVLYKDGTAYAELADMEADLMIGTANAEYIPCIFEVSQNPGKIKAGSTLYLSNVDGTDDALRFVLPLPTNRGGLKLYVKGTLVTTFDADATDYITDRGVFGLNFGGHTTIDTNSVNITTAAKTEDGFGSADCSSYDIVIGRLLTTAATSEELDIAAFGLLCYYDT